MPPAPEADPPVPPPANPDPGVSPPVDPPADPPADDVPAERPAWLPESLWGEKGFNAEAFERYRPPAEDVPSTADAYELPTVEGVDLEETANSPFFATLRTAAFEAGLGNADFQGIVKKWVDAEKEASDSYFTEQQQALGANVETRTSALSTWLDGSLPAEEAEAMRNASTNANVFKALERLMNRGAVVTPRDPPAPVKTRKGKEEIRSLMASKAYSGKPHERDPAVIKEVDDWFAEEAQGKSQ